MTVAGLAVMRSAIPRIVRDLAAIKLEGGKRGEVKWGNAKSYGGKVHKAYINYLFLLIQARKAQLHVRFSPMREYDHTLSGPRKRVDTVSKSFYQLILHRPVRYYGEKVDIWIYPDDGQYTNQLVDKLDPLCIEGYRHIGTRGSQCIRAIECRRSASEPMLQLLDVTLGALAAYRNGRHLAEGYSPVKRELAEYAFAQTRWASITGNNYRKDCNRWNVVPKIKRGQWR